MDYVGREWALVNIGNMFAVQGRYGDAEKIYQGVLEDLQEALEPEHITILDTFHNLGNLYTEYGRVDEAEKMYQRALEGYKNAWESWHPSKLHALYSLGYDTEYITIHLVLRSTRPDHAFFGVTNDNLTFDNIVRCLHQNRYNQF